MSTDNPLMRSLTKAMKNKSLGLKSEKPAYKEEPLNLKPPPTEKELEFQANLDKLRKEVHKKEKIRDSENKRRNVTEDKKSEFRRKDQPNLVASSSHAHGAKLTTDFKGAPLVVKRANLPNPDRMDIRLIPIEYPW